MEVESQKTAIDVDAAIEACKACLKTTDLQTCLNQLYPLEKQTRLNADVLNNSKIQLFMVEACYAAKDVAGLILVMSTLAKKRSIVKQAITSMVQKCAEFVDLMPDNLGEKFLLIEAIREVTEGKIFVEVERARVTRTFAKIREGEGKIKEAADLMQELQVETFGSMEKRERIDFILEQLRLLLAVEDYSKAQIVSRKISPKVFESVEFEDLKLRYYALMIQLCLKDQKYLECSRFHYQIYQSDKDLNQLKSAVVFVVLAKFDHEQSSLINTLNLEKALEEQIPAYKKILSLFLTKELIRWTQVDALFSAELRSCYIFSDPATASKVHIDNFKDRVIEHNIRVISGCFKSVRLARLAGLLDLTPGETESFLCRLIIDGMISGKIDRIAGTVAFRKPLSPEETLNLWASKTDSLLNLMVRTNHAISKEEMAQTIQ